MSCITKITADILECSKLPTKGLKSKAWIFNADEVTFTMTQNKITAITMASGKTSGDLKHSQKINLGSR